MKTENVLQLIKELLAALNIEPKVLEADGPGGSHDTDNIYIEFKDTPNGERVALFICGFDDSKSLTNIEDWSKENVPYIELRDGEDSEEPLSWDEGDVVHAYHALRKKFKDLGYGVVGNMKNFF